MVTQIGQFIQSVRNVMPPGSILSSVKKETGYSDADVIFDAMVIMVPLLLLGWGVATYYVRKNTKP